MRWALLLLSVTVPAQAQPGGSREAVRAACDADVQRFCAAASGNPFRLRPCMRENFTRLQPECQAALRAAGMVPER